MSDFYLTLPSNSSMDVYPENTLTHYQTKLPHRIELDGQWEVGLVEIQYPHNWYNIPADATRTITVVYVGEDSVTSDDELLPFQFTIPPGYYTPTVLLERIKAKCLIGSNRTREEDRLIQLEYDEVDRTYVADTHPYLFDVGPHIASMLGLGINAIPLGPHRGLTAIDIDPIHSLYVYCDVIESRVVGDVLAPLLRIVPVTGKHGETVMKSYHNAHYIPLQRRAFDSVEIDIRDSTGKKVPFERGTLNVTLHFRRRRRVL